jgi:hypothetical protein
MVGIPTPDEMYEAARAGQPLVLTMGPCYVMEMIHSNPIDREPINPLLNSVGIANVDLTLSYQDGSRTLVKVRGTNLKLENYQPLLTGQETDATVADVTNPALMPHLQGEKP